MIEILDYGGGNTGSLLRALDRLTLEYRRINGTDAQPSGEFPMILPGVGSFGAVMKSLTDAGLTEPVKSLAKSGVPLLGICVGLQVLFDGSHESPDVPGLGLLSGEVISFQAAKVPQIGWNEIKSRQEGPYPGDGFVYFVNSYYARPENDAACLYQADYDGPFCAAVRQDNITAFQFHPEKSGAFGQQLIRTWHDAL